MAITTISSGYQTPEVLTETSDGSYLVPDVGVSKIFRMPSESAGFGSPTVFATAPANVEFFGGILLPATFGTTSSGEPLYGVFGSSTAGTGAGVVYIYDPSDQSQSGTGTLFASTSVTASAELSSPVAVGSLGAYSGDVLITSQTVNIVALSPAGTLSVVANDPFSQPTPTTSNGRPFGITQAPGTFGAFSNDVLFDEDASGTI